MQNKCNISNKKTVYFTLHFFVFKCKKMQILQQKNTKKFKKNASASSCSSLRRPLSEQRWVGALPYPTLLCSTLAALWPHSARSPPRIREISMPALHFFLLSSFLPLCSLLLFLLSFTYPSVFLKERPSPSFLFLLPSFFSFLLFPSPPFSFCLSSISSFLLPSC